MTATTSRTKTAGFVAAIVLVGGASVGLLIGNGGGAEAGCRKVGESLSAALRAVDAYEADPMGGTLGPALSAVDSLADVAGGFDSSDAEIQGMYDSAERASFSTSATLHNLSPDRSLITFKGRWEATCGPILNP